MQTLKKIEYAAHVARSFVGCPYVFAATGQICTPSLRRNRAEARPDYAERIYKYCPVLSGSQASCSGCKYEGKQAFDCRGLTYTTCKEAGLKISSVGATTQYNSDDWIEKGPIEYMPKDTPCCVFRQDATNKNVMQHTGFCLGDGYTVDSRGHATGTVINATASYPWTHYAIPKGAFDELDLDPGEETGGGSGTRATVRKGSKGEDVKALQSGLMLLGYSLPKFGADGIFGIETESALKGFQEENSLVIDGICGPATWTRLDALLNADNPVPDPEKTVTFTVTIQGLDAAAATYLLECYPGATAVETVG